MIATANRRARPFGRVQWFTAAAVLAGRAAVAALFPRRRIRRTEPIHRGRGDSGASPRRSGVALAIGLVVAVPAILKMAGIERSTELLVSVLRWPLLIVIALLSLAVVYRYAPNRDKPRWRWISWGAVAATALWLAGSGLFSYYVSHFGNYNKTYGSLGAVVILLLWFFLSAYAVLLGAELNSEMEHQTRKDTTTGPPEPMGQRNAYVADTLGDAQH